MGQCVSPSDCELWWIRDLPTVVGDLAGACRDSPRPGGPAASPRCGGWAACSLGPGAGGALLALRYPPANGALLGAIGLSLTWFVLFWVSHGAALGVAGLFVLGLGPRCTTRWPISLALGAATGIRLPLPCRAGRILRLIVGRRSCSAAAPTRPACGGPSCWCRADARFPRPRGPGGCAALRSRETRNRARRTLIRSSTSAPRSRRRLVPQLVLRLIAFLGQYRRSVAARLDTVPPSPRCPPGTSRPPVDVNAPATRHSSRRSPQSRDLVVGDCRRKRTTVPATSRVLPDSMSTMQCPCGHALRPRMARPAAASPRPRPQACRGSRRRRRARSHQDQATARCHGRLETQPCRHRSPSSGHRAGQVSARWRHNGTRRTPSHSTSGSTPAARSGA